MDFPTTAGAVQTAFGGRRDAFVSKLNPTGSALVYWDSGNPVPPNGNVPPPQEGEDPHGDPRSVPESGVQRVHFFDTGEVIDVFGGAPYCTHRFPRHPELFPDGCPAS